jgi:hypothetical protein
MDRRTSRQPVPAVERFDGGFDEAGVLARGEERLGVTQADLVALDRAPSLLGELEQREARADVLRGSSERRRHRGDVAARFE